jgi:NAD(P)-dependent dehydrogenase (short-subunit alcohol dehydrogenase family)
MGPGPPDTTARGRVLVFGAQGVLGTFLARAFAEAGWEVVRGGRRPEAASDFCQLDLDVPNTLPERAVTSTWSSALCPIQASLRSAPCCAVAVRS